MTSDDLFLNTTPEVKHFPKSGPHGTGSNVEGAMPEVMKYGREFSFLIPMCLFVLLLRKEGEGERYGEKVVRQQLASEREAV